MSDATRIGDVQFNYSRLSDDDVYLFNQGTHYRLYQQLGAHLVEVDGQSGVYFAVWAPNADHVSVIGDFNGWRPGAHTLRPRGGSGIWEGFIPGLCEYSTYKYHIACPQNGYQVNKADPFAFEGEMPPKTASVVRNTQYNWGDQSWMEHRKACNSYQSPIAIYEMHLGSWMRVPEDGNRSLTYREMAGQLADYLKQNGFTHVEFLPVMEHPFYLSWGYQTTGYFSPTRRYGTSTDFKYLIDVLHQNGIGVLLDWVPSHFPSDEHGLGYFDGTHLFEHADPRQGFHPDWKSLIFNYGRHEVRSFLISSALYWLDEFHADGLRVDAVASMLYLDYSRRDGEWIPNPWGGRENVDAINFLRQLNDEVKRSFPDCFTVAEESTSWPMVSRPSSAGGLSFGYKWDMGWMHDVLDYMKRDPVYRKYHHNELTFRGLYQNTENFILPLSHDEVVYGKGSLFGKMAGDTWQKFANLRLLFAMQWTQPGKKLLFMGGEIGQSAEWNHDSSIDWHLLQYHEHRGIQNLIAHLNYLYRTYPALHSLDHDPRGFQWLDPNNVEDSVLTYMRSAGNPDENIVAVFNCTPVPRQNYRVGVPHGGYWRELCNTDAAVYGGSQMGNCGGVQAEQIPWNGQPFSVSLTLPPLAALILG